MPTGRFLLLFVMLPEGEGNAGYGVAVVQIENADARSGRVCGIRLGVGQAEVVVVTHKHADVRKNRMLNIAAYERVHEGVVRRGGAEYGAARGQRSAGATAETFGLCDARARNAGSARYAHMQDLPSMEVDHAAKVSLFETGAGVDERGW